MSHNLAYKNGKANLFVTNSTWHKQESEVSQISTSDEVIRIAQLDYKVEKFPVYCYPNNEVGYTDVSDKYATVRTGINQALGVVGERYTVLQNTDAFKFIDELVGNKQAIFHSAGALGKGERIWLSVKLPHQLVVGQDDIAEHYLFLTNSHDGTKAVEVGFTQTLIVCENTLRIALGNGKRKQKVRHTSNVMDGLFNAADLMGITKDQIDRLQDTYTQFSKVKITDKELRRFIELAMHPGIEQINQEEYSTRFNNTVEKVLEYSLTDDTQQLEVRKGTLWGAVNGVTGFYNNVQTYKNPEEKLNNIMYGTAFRNQNRAIELAVQVLNDSITLS